MWSEEDEAKDREEGRSPDLITMEGFREMANAVYSWVQFTGDIAELHDDQRLPMLDFAMFQKVDEEGNAEITHSFYEKKMASNKVLMAESAL